MKQIAVVLGAINLDNQKKILVGMEEAAKETNSNLFVFTNYVGSQETPESVMAANRLLKLPEFDKFDGAILALNTVHHPETVERILNDVKTLHVPVVSIDRRYEGMSSVEISSYDAEFAMMEHFICDHGYKDIYYVSGSLEQSNEAVRRYNAYKDALEKHNIPYKEENFYEAIFTYESGVEVAEKMLAEGRVPEAIVSGNDDMALGIMDVFQKAGYRIPEDVKIAGFDNGELSRLNKPALTSVDKNQFEVGYKALYELLDLIDGKEPENYVLPCKLELRESCGCDRAEETMEKVYHSMDYLKEKYVEQQREVLRMSDVVRGMTTDFGKARYVHDIMDIIKEYIPLIGVQKYYLCLCEMEKVFVLPERNLGQNIDVLKVNEEYTSLIEIPLAYENGEFKSYQRFEKGFVLPEEIRNASGGNTYVVNQIFYENCCYGYAITERVDSIVGGGLYYSLLMEIGVGLEDVRKWMLLKDAVDRLNGMWCYDNMTHLYNRSGFYNEADSLLERFKAEDKAVFIIFMDADGLKKINDTMGHEAGDRMIQEIARVIHKNTDKDMLAMRYGGDEFVIFGGFSIGDRKRVEDIAAAIEQDIKETNESGKNDFPLSVSMGGSGWRACEVESLSTLIEQADKEMYEHKRAKKAKINN